MTGRVVLLNKDHPKVPEFGRFRPIRIASFAVKLLELFLSPELRNWVGSKCEQQFGFVPGVGCEIIRHTVFWELVRRKNRNLDTVICQIDLSNAYNSVNLEILEKRLIDERIWSEEKLQLWKYLFSRSRTWVEGSIIEEHYGVPQGSLL